MQPTLEATAGNPNASTLGMSGRPNQNDPFQPEPTVVGWFPAKCVEEVETPHKRLRQMWVNHSKLLGASARAHPGSGLQKEALDALLQLTRAQYS